MTGMIWKWTIPLFLMVASLIESIIWEIKGNELGAIHNALIAIVFAILIHKR